MSRPNVYPGELRARAVQMVAGVRPNYESEWDAIGAVAQKLGIGTAETLRKWVRRDYPTTPKYAMRGTGGGGADWEQREYPNRLVRCPFASN